MASWNIKVDNKEYTIKQSMNNLIINGTKYPKKKHQTYTKYLIFQEYKLPIPNTDALMVNCSGKWEIVIDGKYINSGKTYQRIDNIPAWSWAFVIINLMLLSKGGAIPSGLGALGAVLAIRICGNPEYTTAKKLILNTALSAAIWATALIVNSLLTNYINS